MFYNIIAKIVQKKVSIRLQKKAFENLMTKKTGYHEQGYIQTHCALTPVAIRTTGIKAQFVLYQYSSFASAKLVEVKGVKRSYRPSWTGLGVKSQ